MVTWSFWLISHAPYLLAVPGALADQVDYAMLVKIYGADPQAEKRYSPAKCLGAKKKPIEGNPDPKHISTSWSVLEPFPLDADQRPYPACRK